MITIPAYRTSQCYKEVNGVTVYKKKHKTSDEAIQAAKNMNAKENQIHKAVAYKCAICGFYHIGRSKKEIKHE